MAYSSSGASQTKYVVFLCLLLIPKLSGVASEQVSEKFDPQIKYDVFVNFRGEDIRHDFLGYLTEALHQKQIHAFVDEKLEKGAEIWPSLLRAIEGSFISLIIFSRNYASSRWCLDELAKILECREKYGQTVIPVFFDVDPTTVTYQSGSYSEAFVEHEKNYTLTTVQNWRQALKKAADLSGIVSFDYRTEVELLREIINIVNLVLMKSDKHTLNLKGLVGIDKPIQYLESLLHQESKNVLVIGIWGMGGIGKTTIAAEIFNKLYSKYDGSCFLANVKEEAGRHGIISLKEKLFSTILAQNVKMSTAIGLSNYIRRRIGRMKVLIVLDDVTDLNLLEKLFGNPDWFGPGSRIIITTRDKQVLLTNKADDIYHVGALNSSEAHELFSFYAFNQSHFDTEYYKLSKRVVNYAKGIPLVLKVLGHLLRGKDKDVWESQLDKLKSMPNTDVYNVMRLSYDDLDRKEQQILLDLACFFIGLDVKVDHIKTLLKDSERDDSVLVGLERLKDKALITISEDNVVSMHDIIQEMGWEIVRRESIEDPGSRSRLRDPEDIYEVLQNDKGTEAIRSVRVDLSLVRKLNLSPNMFARMSKLQFLYFPSKYIPTFELGRPELPGTGLPDPESSSIVSDLLFHGPLSFPVDSDLLLHGFQSFPVALRCLYWKHYPLKYLPEKFSAENLVILDLQDSQVEKLWDGVQNCVNLKEVEVSGSKNLKELPDLSKATNLEVLDISFCPQLTSVAPSIFSLKKLNKLDLSYCSLTKLTSDDHLSSLSYLNLGSCRKLREFSVIAENMIQLDLSSTIVKALPSSFERQKKLEMLWLRSSGIESLPSSLKNLMSLRYLNVYDSQKLHTLTELPPSLETLYATDCTTLKTILFPSIEEQFKENRKQVSFWNCLELDEHSLKAVELNAHINVMKSAYQHLSAPDENYDDYNRSYGLYQVKYVYPGSIVPEWLEYKTTEDYMIIDLSSTSQSSSLGFIFCFVVGDGEFERLIGHEFTFHITISDFDDGGKKDSIEIYISDSNIWPLSNHVCVIYDQRCSRYLSHRAKNQTMFKIKVNAMETSVARRRGVGLKGFGVSPINAPGYHNFMEYINTTAYNNFIQQINTSADHSFFQQMEVSRSMYFISILGTIICLSLWWLSYGFGFRRLMM